MKKRIKQESYYMNRYGTKKYISRRGFNDEDDYLKDFLERVETMSQITPNDKKVLDIKKKLYKKIVDSEPIEVE